MLALSSSDDTDDDWHKQGRFDGHSIASVYAEGQRAETRKLLRIQPWQRRGFSVNDGIPPGIDRFPGSLRYHFLQGAEGAFSRHSNWTTW